MSSDHNPLFETFVRLDHPSDSLVEGLIAYGLYKKAKREWAQSLFEREGRPPNTEELKGYIAAWTPSQIEGKQTEARQLLGQFSSDVIEAAKPDIREDALRGRFWGGVWQSVFATMLYTAILIGLVVILAISGVDVLGMLERLRS